MSNDPTSMPGCAAHQQWFDVACAECQVAALCRERDEAREFALEEGGRATAAEDTARKLERERDEAVERYKTAERLFEESDQEYEDLVHVLQLRFPRRPDGTLPDWKVEDVLEENRALKAKLQQVRKRMQNTLPALEAARTAVGRFDSSVAAHDRAKVSACLGAEIILFEKALADLGEGGDDA